MQEVDRHDLEGIARDMVESVGVGESLPVPIRAVAVAHGLELLPMDRGDSVLAGRKILYRRGLRVREDFTIAHELAHYAFRRAGADFRSRAEEERAANHVAGAMLLPAATVRHALAAYGQCWETTIATAGVSWETFARRYVGLFSSVVTIWDWGRVTWRDQSPWLRRRFVRIPKREMELAQLARTERNHIPDEDMLCAWYIERDGWPRVVTRTTVDTDFDCV